MISVDVVTSFRFNEIVGPIGTIRRILQNRAYFIKCGLNITVFNHGLLVQDWYNSRHPAQNGNHAKSGGRKIKHWFDNQAIKRKWLSVLLVEYKFWQKKKIVSAYLKTNRKADIVVFHSELACYFYLKRNRHAKVAVFFHNDGIPYQMLRLYYPKLEQSWYLKVLLKRYEYVINHVDRCVFICRKGMHNINSSFPQSIAKSSLVINGIDDLGPSELVYIRDIKNNREPEKIIRLCCVGSVSIRKGQRNVIEAIGMLDANMKEHYRLIIVGDGSDLDYCKELACALGVASMVEFAGAVPNMEVYKYLANADVFVLLSRNEGMPISIIEAMRAGLAIISTNVSGIPEMVDHKNGILIAPTSEALHNVLLHGERLSWSKMGEQSRKRYEEEFTFARMRRDYVNMIYETMGFNKNNLNYEITPPINFRRAA